MKSETLQNLYESELARLMEALPKAAPGSEEYSRIFYIIGDIEYRLERLEVENPVEPEAEATTHVVDTTTAPAETEPVIEEAPAPVIEEAESAPAESDTEYEYVDPESLRAALADAKKKGVNISELISSLGATNFSGLRDDQNKLRQLKTLMENALKEIA